MKRFLLAAALTMTGLVGICSQAQAMPRDPLTGLVTSPIEEVQLYVYGGRRYCFYPDGWRGPGYYWCGYAWRRGFGWGGYAYRPRLYAPPRAYRRVYRGGPRRHWR